MKTSFLTATAFAALIGFGGTAMAQQSQPALDAPAIQKSAPAQTGKSGTVQNKSGSTTKQGASTSADSKAKPDDRAAARRAASQACADIKDKAAHDTCMRTHLNQAAKNQPAKGATGGKVDNKAATPDSAKAPPRVGG